MINILLAGVGGQGTVLAAKVLAQAAQNKGWQVRTAETIGMAQRGGSVVSHVRMGSEGEAVHAPLVTPGTADVIIAFEPGEAARSLGYLKPGGTVVSATSLVQPVTAALSSAPYSASEVVANLREALDRADASLRLVNDGEVLAALGNRRALNTVLLATAVACGAVPLTLEELKRAVTACVKPQFVDVNIAAIDAAAQR
ncbi:MAG TPA: indolepyruvate oxidoreductase subunit beta [Candidatus Aphodovivens excrementavium]|nr:indolepyruvate oxidoreductase subunit beta [Candidatus Aphodovivens excrementavium]